MFIVVRLRQRSAPLRHHVRQLLLPSVVATATAGALLVPFLLPAVSYNTRGGPVPPFAESALYSLSLEDYLMPPPGHPVTQYWVDDALEQGNYERTVYPGVAVLLLALGPVAIPWARRKGLALIAVAAVAGVLSFGPVLRWFGEPVVVDVGVRAWNLHQVVLLSDPKAPPTAMAVPMPVYPIARFVPVLKGLRVWERAAELTILAVDVLAALTPTALGSRLPRRTSLVAGLLVLAFVTVDGMMAPDILVKPEPRPVDAWLAGQPGRFGIIQLPFERGVSGTQLYYSSFHGKDVVLAQASVLPRSVTDAALALRAFPSGREWVDVLQRWRVRYVLVDEARDAVPELHQAVQANGLKLATLQDGVAVFEVPGTPAQAR